MKTNENKKSVWGKRLKRGLIGGALVLVLLLTVTSGYELIASSKAYDRFPPPGKLVDVGGFELHINKQGNGGPTILFEGGSGEASTYWDSIADSLSSEATVITYDRAGYNWSDKHETERTGENIVKELHTALEQEGITGPYIIVGHSIGGMYARLYAQMYKEEVAGLLLLDARHEDFTNETKDMFERLGIDSLTAGLLPETLVKTLRTTGLLRLLREPIMSSSYETKEDIDFAVDITMTNKTLKAIREELENIPQVEDAIRGVHLGDVPLTIITGETDFTVMGFTEEEDRELKEEWLREQKAMLQLSTNSKHLIAEQSGHHIAVDEPALVIETIHDMIKDVD